MKRDKDEGQTKSRLLTFDSSDSEAIDLIRGETERNSFLDIEGSSLVVRASKSQKGKEGKRNGGDETNLFEETVEIDVNGVA